MRGFLGAGVLFLAVISSPHLVEARVRLGTLDMRAVLDASRASPEARQRYRAHVRGLEKDLEPANAEIVKLRAQAAATPDVTRRAALNRLADEKLAVYQARYARLQSQVKQAEDDLLADAARRIRSVATRVGQRLRLAGVVDARGVYYSSPDTELVEITAEVTRELDGKLRDGSAPSKPRAPAPRK